MEPDVICLDDSDDDTNVAREKRRKEANNASTWQSSKRRCPRPRIVSVGTVRKENGGDNDEHEVITIADDEGEPDAKRFAPAMSAVTKNDEEKKKVDSREKSNTELNESEVKVEAIECKNNGTQTTPLTSECAASRNDAKYDVEDRVEALLAAVEYWLTSEEMTTLRAKLKRKVSRIEATKRCRRELCKVIDLILGELKDLRAKEEKENNNNSRGGESTKGGAKHWTLLRDVIDAFGGYIRAKPEIASTTNRSNDVAANSNDTKTPKSDDGNKNGKANGDANNDAGSSSSGEARRRFQILKLEEALKACHAEIRRLEESEVDFNKEGWDDIYLTESKYKARCTKIYKRLQELRGLDPSLSWQRDKKLRLNCSKHEQINIKLQLLVRKEIKKRREPDFNDVVAVISKVNEESNIGLNTCQIQEEAKSNFRSIVSIVKQRSQTDFWRTMESYFQEEDKSLTSDPLEGNAEMQQRLRESEKRREAQFDAIIKKYSEKQNEVGEDPNQDNVEDDDEEEEGDEVDESEEDEENKDEGEER